MFDRAALPSPSVPFRRHPRPSAFLQLFVKLNTRHHHPAAERSGRTVAVKLNSRDHLRALAQRIEVAEGEVRIIGSKSDLLRTLANGNAKGTGAKCTALFRSGGP